MAMSRRSSSDSSASPSRPRPVLADVAQLSDERRRGRARRHPHELDERAAARDQFIVVGKGALKAGDGLGVAGALGQDAVVDELVERTQCRVLVGDPGQQQFLEPFHGRLRRRSAAGELRRVAVQQTVGVRAELLAHLAERGGHRRGSAGRLVPGDEQVADLVKEAQRPDLAGPDPRRPGRALGIHPGGQSADRGHVGHDDVAADAGQARLDLVAFARRPPDVEIAGPRDVDQHRRSIARGRRGRQAPTTSAGRLAAMWSMARRSSSRPDGSNSYDHGRTRSVRVSCASRPAARASRDMRMTSAISSTIASRSASPMSAGTISMPVAPDSWSVSRMLSAPRSFAQTRPTREPAGQPGDLVDELEVARSQEHRDDRDAAGGQDLALIGMERGRGDEVVVEPVEALGHVVDERALGLDQARKGVHEPLRVVAGVGAGALGEEDAHERPGALALRGRGERGGCDFVRGEPGVRRSSKHLGHDARECLRSAPLGRAIGHVGARAMSTRDVAGIGQTSIDRPDGIGVHSEGSAELPDRGEAGTRQEPTGVDLIGELPIDLGRDGDIRIALDVEAVTGGGARHGRGVRLVI